MFGWAHVYQCIDGLTILFAVHTQEVVDVAVVILVLLHSQIC